MVHTTLGRVATRRLARKEEIFTTALGLAEKEGRDGLTVHRLAEALNLTPGALYRYFPSKNLLLAELQDYVQKQVLALFTKARLQWGGDGKAGSLLSLLQAADFYLALEKTAPRYAILLGLMVGDPRRFQEEAGLRIVAPSALALFDELETLFDCAQHCGAILPGGRREKTLAYWAALHGAKHLDKLQDVEKGLKDSHYYGIQMARTLLLGWGASKRDLERAWRKR